MKTVIEMAKECDLVAGNAEHGIYLMALQRFAELVRADAIAAEREACAKVCESEWSNVAERIYGEECAAAIRARSNT